MTTLSVVYTLLNNDNKSKTELSLSREKQIKSQRAFTPKFEHHRKNFRARVITMF